MADLTTWTKVKAVFDLDDSRQTEAERLITVASQRAEDYTRRILAAADATKYYHGNDQVLLMLDQWPVNSITSVHIDQDMDWEDGDEVTDYKIRSEIGALYRSAYWPAGRLNIKVVGNFGFETVPADLEESIIQLVGYWLDSPTVGWLSSGNLEDGGYQTRYIGAGDLPFQVRQVWDLYRKVMI
jgi:hypothetical protein